MISPEEWRTAGSAFDFRGHRIFFRRGGTGPTLLLVHGFPTSGWDFQALWPDLVTGFDVVVPDLLGFGFSAKPMPHAYRVVEQADLCEALLRHLGASGRYHLLVHDYGVSVGQELLAREAPLITAAFLNGGMLPEAHRARTIQKVLAGPLGPLLVRFTSRRRFNAQMTALFGKQTPPSEADLAGFWQLIQVNDGMRAVPALLDYLRERREHRDRWVGALLGTKVPVRLINGNADPVSGRHLVDGLLKLKPALDVKNLPAIGHYPQVEAPAEVLAEWMSFVRPHLT